MVEPCVKILNLTKIFRRRLALWRYEKITVLKGLCLEVQKGSTVVIQGPNGSGKTTLLKCIAGLIRPTSGSLFVGGDSPFNSPKAVHSRIGFFSGDERGFYPRLSAWENLRVFGATHNLFGAKLSLRIAELAERLKIIDNLRVRYGELSRGMKARVAFCRAMLHDPEILLLDEAFRSIDFELMVELKEWLYHDLVSRKGKAVLFVSHRNEELEGLSGRLLHMDKGEIEREDRIEDSRPVLTEARKGLILS